MTMPTYAELEAQAAALTLAVDMVVDWLRLSMKEYVEKYPQLAGNITGNYLVALKAALAPEAGRKLLERLARAEAALKQIAEHPHCSYEARVHSLPTRPDRQYEIGVADGHRCAAEIARVALAPAPKEGA